MRRRRHRRRNPNNQTLIYIGAGLAILGVGYILYQNSQAQPAAATLPSGGTAAAPAGGSSLVTQGIAVGSAYYNCIQNGGNALSCLGLSQS